MGLAGFAVLLWLIDRADAQRPLRSAFWRGWLTGLSYFSISLWWISEAFMVDAEAHGWQAPFAVALLAGGLALLWGLAATAYKLIAPSSRLRVVVFAAIFAVEEWLRGHILTGLPWNLPGEAWRAGDAISQVASVFGVYGLTLITLAIFASPALLAGPGPVPRRLAGPGMALAALGLIWGLGQWRLDHAATGPEGPVVRIVQSNVPQAIKWDLKSFTEILDRHTRLTAEPAKGHRPDIVIWSESAIPAALDDYMAPYTWTRAQIESSLEPGQVLVVGAPRSAHTPQGRRDFNSLAVFRRTPEGLDRLGVYDKAHLVPFGEYFPMDRLATWLGLKKLVHVGDGFTAGPPARVTPLAGLPAMAPMICYESLFPGAIADAGSRAAWIVNVSNDAWFGATSGPIQHYNMARYRSIEQGLPMARSTPTGVSAMVDAYGRPVAEIGQGRMGVIDVPLPPALVAPPYHNWGETPFWIACLVCLSPAALGPIVAGRAKSRSAASYNRRAQLSPDSDRHSRG
jgi:apolipoprotein N-acyltransferase